MKTKVFALLALLFLPFSAVANGCHDDRQATRCPVGQIWDAGVNACVIQSS
ncbi:hypothetical protein [Phaeovulum sp.]|uniref:hypothetical protein n=1 Tax=Phaeovulum sp. TaxID=2934796 RepID=UPI0039E6636C